MHVCVWESISHDGIVEVVIIDSKLKLLVIHIPTVMHNVTEVF